jgi:hypothetical protein
VFTVDDLVYMPGHPSIFVAQVETDFLKVVRNALEGVEVTFLLDGEVVGAARTDNEGRAQLVEDVDPAAQTKTISAATRVRGKSLSVERPIHRWDSGKVIVVVDVDHTLARTDYESLLTDALDTESEPYADSQRVVSRLAEHYELVYVTARPRFLLQKTRDWLNRFGFPDAPLVTTRSVGALLQQAEKKRDLLARRKELWPNMLIGIGDKRTDAEAYAAVGLLSVMLAPAEVPPASDNLVMVANWTKLGEFFEGAADTLRDPQALRDVLARDAGQSLIMPEDVRDE